MTEQIDTAKLSPQEKLKNLFLYPKIVFTKNDISVIANIFNDITMKNYHFTKNNLWELRKNSKLGDHWTLYFTKDNAGTINSVRFFYIKNNNAINGRSIFISYENDIGLFTYDNKKYGFSELIDFLCGKYGLEKKLNSDVIEIILAQKFNSSKNGDKEEKNNDIKEQVSKIIKEKIDELSLVEKLRLLETINILSKLFDNVSEIKIKYLHTHMISLLFNIANRFYDFQDNGILKSNKNMNKGDWTLVFRGNSNDFYVIFCNNSGNCGNGSLAISNRNKDRSIDDRNEILKYKFKDVDYPFEKLIVVLCDRYDINKKFNHIFTEILNTGENMLSKFIEDEEKKIKNIIDSENYTDEETEKYLSNIYDSAFSDNNKYGLNMVGMLLRNEKFIKFMFNWVYNKPIARYFYAKMDDIHGNFAYGIPIFYDQMQRLFYEFLTNFKIRKYGIETLEILLNKEEFRKLYKSSIDKFVSANRNQIRDAKEIDNNIIEKIQYEVYELRKNKEKISEILMSEEIKDETNLPTDVLNYIGNTYIKGDTNIMKKEEQKNQTGGYLNKYIKYKLKYLSAKNKNHNIQYQI